MAVYICIMAWLCLANKQIYKSKLIIHLYTYIYANKSNTSLVNTNVIYFSIHLEQMIFS